MLHAAAHSLYLFLLLYRLFARLGAEVNLVNFKFNYVCTVFASYLQLHTLCQVCVCSFSLLFT